MGKPKEKTYSRFTWIDILNPHKDQLEEIALENNLDYFQVLDSLEHGHLPKIEKIEHYNFVILRAYTGKKTDKRSTVSELSNKIAFFYSDKKIITVHREKFEFLELAEDEFASVDQLMLKIIDGMVESFVEPSEWHSNRIDELEKVIFLKDYAKISLEDLYFQKSQTRIIKKLLQITSEVVNKLSVEKESIPALQDIKDKLFRLVLIYDEAVEDANNLLNTHMGITAKKSNDVMKLLTIFSAFFLPLTFIVGVYGMNFHYMPELTWTLGYLWVLLFMALVCLLIFIWFKKKKIL